MISWVRERHLPAAIAAAGEDGFQCGRAAGKTLPMEAMGMVEVEP
jgi:hypothetical protein